MFVFDHEVKKALKSVKQNIFSRFHTLTLVSISLSNTVGCVTSSTVSHAVALTAEVTWMNNKRQRLYKWKVCVSVNSCHPSRQLKNLVKQCFTTKCSNSSVALFMQSKKQFALEKGFPARLGIFDSFPAHSQDPSSVANVGLHFPHLVFEDDLEARFFQSFFCHRLKFFFKCPKISTRSGECCCGKF